MSGDIAHSFCLMDCGQYITRVAAVRAAIVLIRRRDHEVRFGLVGLQGRGARVGNRHHFRPATWQSLFRVLEPYWCRAQPARMEFDDAIPIGTCGAKVRIDPSRG